MRRLSRHCRFFGLGALFLAATSSAAEPGQPSAVNLPKLTVDAPIERSVAATTAFESRIVVSRNHYVHIEIEVNGMRAAGRMFSPTGQLVAETAEITGFTRTSLSFVSRVG